jgi:DNA-binding NtrC family response regulator
MVIRGEFRVDLLARLSGHKHTLAPLRDRMEDLGILVRDLLARSEVAGAIDLGFTAQAGKWLLSQAWPQNIRELSQVLGVAAALADGPLIERAHLLETSPEKPALPEENTPASPEDLRGRIVSLLEKHRGNVSYVARDMGKARVQIRRWMQRLSINADEYRQ